MNLAIAAHTVLILTGAVLFYVAFTDLKHYKIRNDFILILTGLFFLHAFLSGRWTTLPWNLGFAALLFLIMLYPYSKKMMGGGDLKLLTVAILWVGPFCALPVRIVFASFCRHSRRCREIQVGRGEGGWRAAISGFRPLCCGGPHWRIPNRLPSARLGEAELYSADHL